MRFLWVLFALLTTTACGQRGQRFTISDDPHTSIRSAEGVSAPQGAIHSLMGWQQVVPFKIDASFDGEQSAAIKRAAATWNEAVGREVLYYAGTHEGSHGPNLYSSLDDTETVIYLEPSWKATTGKMSSTLATTVWENSPDNAQAIDRGDVIMNSEFYLFADASLASEPNDGRALADMESVVLHELGHLLGLNHVSPDEDSASVMLAYTMIGENVYHRQLSEQDMENIRSIYDK